ncbi:polymorphic toxin-type HINT domain-containing protein [Amycolatopsis sp. VC5-11]|uniref:polymorphic toxin-type HINT domain-containing protein n=1 Tax=Amycolatopsis sp. VC5-11 TaxID=3120156 RepID=UPI00300A57CF
MLAEVQASRGTSLVDVTVAAPGGPKKITSTAHQRWRDATTHTWTDASNLRPGDLLDSPGNGHAAVQTLSRYTTSIRTYNLTVDTTHTYYLAAGKTPVLVHNGYRDKIAEVRESHDEVRQGSWNPDSGGGNDYLFFREGNDLLLTKSDGQFVTMFPMDKPNRWFEQANPR